MLMGNKTDRVNTLCAGSTRNVRGEVMSSNLLSELMSKKVELSSVCDRCSRYWLVSFYELMQKINPGRV